jgi:hypothetical protein
MTGDPAFPGRRSLSVALTLVLAAATALGSCDGCRRTKLRPRGDGAAVVVVDPVAASGGQAPEREPNNTVAAAQPLALAGDPLVAGVAGTLPGTGKNADSDVFKVAIPGGADAAPPDGGALGARRLMVEVRPDPDLALVLQLLDAAGRPVVTTSATPGEPDGVPNLAVAPGGTYYVRVRAVEHTARSPDAAVGGTATGGYRLSVRVVDFELGEEREPNDRPAQATDLGAAARNPEAAGFYGWRKDEDWYRLSVDALPAGSVLDLEVEAVDGVVPGVAVHDAAGSRLVGTHGRRGERVALRNIAVPAAAAPVAEGAPGRAVYVVIRTEGGRNIDRRYALHVRAGLAQEGTETEPNDDPTRPSPLGEGLTTGFLGPSDIDVYRYAPALPVTADFEVTPPTGGRVKMELLRQRDGEVLATAASAARGQPEKLSAISVAEPVLLRITSRRTEGNPDEPYQIRVQSAPAAPPAGAPP